MHIIDRKEIEVVWAVARIDWSRIREINHKIVAHAWIVDKEEQRYSRSDQCYENAGVGEFRWFFVVAWRSVIDFIIYQVFYLYVWCSLKLIN